VFEGGEYKTSNFVRLTKKKRFAVELLGSKRSSANDNSARRKVLNCTNAIEMIRQAIFL